MMVDGCWTNASCVQKLSASRHKPPDSSPAVIGTRRFNTYISGGYGSNGHRSVSDFDTQVASPEVRLVLCKEDAEIPAMD
jgi:hypothetical protein